MNRLLHVMLISISLILLAGCFRGETSEKPPVHLVKNMDTQEKYKSYRKSNFFVNGSAMRMPVDGTVAIGDLHENTVYYAGINDAGTFVINSPMEHSPDFVLRGSKQYEIFCTPCHGSTGDGMGLMINYVYPPATSMHSNRVLTMPDGQIFSVISNGNVLMPSYKHQIPVDDRWAIVSYVRELQTTVNLP
ncbi:MAG: cytochrome c [Candidatus Marinimicrobia bacterium]|nr:cytochrome c [Candidatus Neomarinimicrobiota bacterium]